jgi:hypothetical protein
MTDRPLVVRTPTAGVDPRVALATAMYAGAGVYAFLIGSGMSSAAGIPTGWQVVQDLIRKVAIAEGVDHEEVGAAPEEWWARQGRPEPKYDTLLEALAPTDAARQALLRSYFDPPPQQGGPIRPTPGHVALAQLCATGGVRLILTTNFDRLLERALDGVGLTPQVIVSPDAANGMIPLTHAPLTVVKLHGDYAMPGLRNTPEELSTYPPEWNKLLDRVFDEFGLVVVGWSADYDTALAGAISRAVSRRYPMFWTSYRGNLSEAARRLIALRTATVIDTTGADEFLVDLAERIRRLNDLAVHRRRPTTLRSYNYPPNPSSANPGWTVIPLLQLRAACEIRPATPDTVGPIRPENREAQVHALRVAAVREDLYPLSAAPAMNALTEATGVADPPPLVDWESPADVQQSAVHSICRLGGDGAAGVSCLVTVRFPTATMAASVVITCDVGVSIGRLVRVGEAAQILRDGLVLVTAVLPNVFGDLLPPDADVHQAEVHLIASNMDGNGKSRPNDLPHRLDLSTFGPPPAIAPQSFGFAALISTPLTQREAVGLVVEAFELAALSSGYIDPRVGIASLRQELGLPGPS